MSTATTEEANYWYAKSHMDADYNAMIMRPSYYFKPRLSIDGNKWCALYGENLQDGVAGFGASPQEAYEDFDRNWYSKLPNQ